jgi:cobalt-zinc-cadmium efflux system outer membrane protein
MKLPLLIIAFCALAASAAAQTETPPASAAAEPLTLAVLEQLALANNPTFRAAQAGIEAARGRARQAGAWPNPVMGYSGEELKAGDLDARGEHGFFVEQTIPLGGKLRLGRQVFERSAERAEAVVEIQRQRILSSVRTLFYEALTAERRVEVQERLAVLASEAVGVTAQLFNVGAADRPDFLESEVEAHRVRLALNDAKNRAFAVRQQLAAVAGRSDVTSRPFAGSIDQAIPELERDAALRALVEESPQMLAARAEVARTQAVTAQAKRTTFPDLFLRGGAAHNRERGEDTGRSIGWEGQLEAGLSVPLFNRNRGGIAAARAEESVAQLDLRRLELSLQSRAAAEFATYLTALRASESYRADILPRAEEAYRLYLARYREMAAAYPQVLVAQRTLFEMSADYLESLDDAWRSALRIQGFLTGEGLQAPDGSVDGGGEDSITIVGERGGGQ